jgi:hypothetical protein
LPGAGRIKRKFKRVFLVLKKLNKKTQKLAMTKKKKKELILEICLSTDRYRFIYFFSTVIFAVHLGRIIHVTKGEEITPILNKI